MKHVIFILSGLLLAGCSVLPVATEKKSADPTTSVMHPLLLNPTVLAITAQLQRNIPEATAHVWRLGNEVKVTFAADSCFGVDGSTVSPNVVARLKTLVQIAGEYPETVWRVDVFTDNRGEAKKNLQRSEVQAQAIALYFINQGVAAARITEAGYGGDFPITDDDSAAGQAMNRRVVVTIRPGVPAG